MKLCFSTQGWEDLTHWIEHDRKTLEKLLVLICECQRTQFSGLGKPEPLRGELKGFWSRRITQEHRLVYRITGSEANQQIEIAACRYHYG